MSSFVFYSVSGNANSMIIELLAMFVKVTTTYDVVRKSHYQYGKFQNVIVDTE
jgi:hypothetical protein